MLMYSQYGNLNILMWGKQIAAEQWKVLLFLNGLLLNKALIRLMKATFQSYQ